MTGTNTYKSKYFVSNIRITVTQSSVTLSGTGTIYGLAGNALASGTIKFKPNWAAGTIEACIGNFCVTL